jgi:hypothetical protein
MKRVLLVAAAAVGAAGLAAGTAFAKGPTQAMISGPGLDGAIVVRGDAESTPGTNFWTLVQQTGWFATVFGQQSPDPTLKARPKGNLGPHYDVVYLVPGPDRKSTLRQDVYPYAQPSPVAHMAPGQRFWGNQSTRGGWVRGNASLRKALVALGLPAKAPSQQSAGLSTGVWTGIALGAALLLGGLGSVLARRRPRGGTTG